MIEIIAFDGDDTLWHNEPYYLQAKDEFKQLLLSRHKLEGIDPGFDEIEIHNIQYYGYGIKSFALSMIEAAITLTQGQAGSQEIQGIINIAKQMLDTPVQVFDQTEKVLAELSISYPLILITKGDTFEQERKVKRTGLSQYFSQIEIVGDKSIETYRAVLNKYHIDPQRFLMVGNSLRSDILPVLSISGKAVYVPYEQTWSHESAEIPAEFLEEFYEIQHLDFLPQLVGTL